MFQSQYFLSKKGPLASIWVAAYCLKRLHRDQIVQTDIPSSVDKILIDEWPTVSYRILAYLLLGVVRIYSKKVEFVLHDCREIINDLNKFLGKKKAVPFREIVNAQDFSVTLPERYELDAFVLEAHTAKKEDIIIQGGSFQYEKSIKKCSVGKCLGDFAVQETTIRTVSKTSTASIKLKGCSSAQNPPESPEEMETCSTALALALVENCTEFGSGTSSSLLVRNIEESIEEFREIRFSREECLDIEMFYQNDKEHLGIFESPNIIQGSNVEHSEFIRMMQTENTGIFHSEVEDETGTVERICYLTTPSDNPDHASTEEKEANFTLVTSPNLSIPSNNHNCFAVVDEENFTNRSPNPEIALDDHRSVTAAKTVITSDLEWTSQIQSIPDDHKNVTAGKNVIITDLERVSHVDTSTPLTSGKEKTPLKVDTTPDLKVPVAKEPGSTGRFSVPTPANKESSFRKANKRKCIYDDTTVLSNQTIKSNIDDTSDLVRKRRRVPHTSNTTTRIVMDLKDIRRKPNDADQVETVETVETVEAPNDPVVVAISPPRSVSDGLLSTIAPGTPVRCSTSSRAFVTPRAADSDGETPFLSFQNVRKEIPCQSFENATRDFVGDSVEEIVLDLMDKDMDLDGDSQKLDGWSTRTRTVAMWLHQVLASKTKLNEAKTANLTQILDGKLKKESARVFYEILVLRSGEYVNVSQEGAYKDIMLQETRNMERKLAKCAV
ncbi:hypothetical protein V2J09_015775 [Rumex salicifolius]